jgi:hypothetical protein
LTRINDAGVSTADDGGVGITPRDKMALTFDDPVDASNDAARVNLGDRNSIDAVCAAFRCVPTDVYVAVSMVGDRICDVHRFLAALTQPHSGPLAPISKGGPLPPIWSQHKNAIGR